MSPADPVGRMRPAVSAPDEALGSRRRRRTASRTRWRDRLGGVEGNEILTSTVAVVLTLLLVAEGVTVVHMQGLLSAHMFIGLVLIPPVLVKLGSTGYRFARYYTRARPYREKGPPLLLLRVLAPVLVASTIVLLGSGVLLLAQAHRSRTLLQVHQTSFWVFLVVFAVHFVAYLPRVVRSLLADWRAARPPAVPGSSIRTTLVALAIGGGLALAVAVLPAINTWHR